MRNSILILLIVLIFSCTNEKKNEIILFNDIQLNLNDDEKVVDINPEITKRYFTHLRSHPFQIPLFKYIKNSNYEVFIGIPTGASINKLINSQIIKQAGTLVDSKSDSVSYLFKKYEKENYYLTEYVLDYEKNLFYLLSVCNSKHFSDSLFNYLELSKRFSSNKE